MKKFKYLSKIRVKSMKKVTVSKEEIMIMENKDGTDSNNDNDGNLEGIPLDES